MVPLNEEFARKLVFLCGLKPWVWKILYQRIEHLKNMPKFNEDGGMHGG
jgi:hypothetical protein